MSNQPGTPTDSSGEQEHHDEWYEKDAERIFNSWLVRLVNERVARDFLHRAGLGPDSRVLDLGCGEGHIDCLLAPSVGQLVGYDISPVGIEQARKRASDAGLSNVSFEVGDLSRPEGLAYADEFDGVCAFGFLHHLPLGGIAGIFDLAHRALRPDGAFYSVDPNARRLVRHFSRLVQRKYDHYHSPDEHELEPQVLVGLALEAGLASPHVRASDYFANPLGWILPGLPRALASPLVWLDHGLSALPVVNRYSSSFSLLARKPVAGV